MEFFVYIAHLLTYDISLSFADCINSDSM